jgi:hypothetical protein
MAGLSPIHRGGRKHGQGTAAAPVSAVLLRPDAEVTLT